MAASSQNQVLTPADPGAVTIAIALIGGAFAIIAAAIFGAGGYFDKIDRLPLMVGLVLGILGIATLLASVAFGGSGIAYGTTTGGGNAFDRQAWCGLIGVALICAAATVFGLNKKPDEKGALERRIEELDRRVLDLNARVAGLQAQVTTLNATIQHASDKQSKASATSRHHHGKRAGTGGR